MTPQIKQRIEQIRRGEVPEGYKKTKIGIVPSEWENYLFSDLFVPYNEHTQDLDRYPLYSLTIEDGITAKTERYERSHLVKKEDSYKIVRPNDFAYNPMNLRFGAVSRHKGNNCVCVSGYYDIFTTKYNSDLAFMDCYLTSDKMITYYNKVSIGSLVEKQRVHFSQFLEFNLPLPNLRERERIAEILKTQDHVIELCEREVEQLKKLKKAFLQKMFPKTGESVPEWRFPEFADAWEQRKLGDIASSFEYGLNAAAKEYDGVNKYLRITDIDDSSRAFRDDDLTSPDIDLSLADNYQLHEGEILCARTGASVGKAFIYRESDGLVYFAGFLIRARIKPEYDAEFVFQNTLCTTYEKYIQITSQRSGQPGVNAQEYAEYSFLLPSYAEQKEIGSFLRQIDNLITLHQRKCDEEKQKKKALMQLLLTGIVRVKT